MLQKHLKRSGHKMDIKQIKRKLNSSVPYMTFFFIIVNVLIFVIEEIVGDSEAGDVVLKMGALYMPKIKEGQWYRFFMACFLHFGYEHLAGNMLALFAVGPYVEGFFGHLKFTVIYLAAGISGNAFVYLMEQKSGEFNVTAGASGAIFGLFGVLIIFAFNREMRETFPLPRVILGLILMFVPSFTETGISLNGHIGGFLGGTIVGFLFYIYLEKRNNKRRN
jgi:rhomboid protease GluP